jgi:hypothetical protein
MMANEVDPLSPPLSKSWLFGWDANKTFGAPQSICFASRCAVQNNLSLHIRSPFFLVYIRLVLEELQSNLPGAPFEHMHMHSSCSVSRAPTVTQSSLV